MTRFKEASTDAGAELTNPSEAMLSAEHAPLPIVALPSPLGSAFAQGPQTSRKTHFTDSTKVPLVSTWMGRLGVLDKTS